MNVHPSIIFVLCLVYGIQLWITWVNLFYEQFKTKRDFLYWHIPYLPIITSAIKKFQSIGK